MIDLGLIRTVLRTAYKPCPRSSSRDEIASAAAAIDRMTVAAKAVDGLSRAAVIDNLAESR